MSYKLSQLSVIWRGVDLTPSVDSNVQLVGSVTVDRRRVLSSGVIGLTADGIDCGMSVRMACRWTDNVKSAYNGTWTGNLMVASRDATWAWAMPALLEAVPITAPSGGIVGANLSFYQAAGTAVAGTLVTATGAMAIAANKFGYHYDDSANTLSGKAGGASVSYTLATDDLGVVGDPIVAEG